MVNYSRCVARQQKSVLSHHQMCREGGASQAGGRSEGPRGRESSAQGWCPKGGYLGKRIEGGVLNFVARSWSTPRLSRRLVLRQRRQDLLGALLTQVCVLMGARRAADARGGMYHADLGVLSSSGRRPWRASAGLKRKIVAVSRKTRGLCWPALLLVGVGINGKFGERGAMKAGKCDLGHQGVDNFEVLDMYQGWPATWRVVSGA